MKLIYKKPSKETMIAMGKVAENPQLLEKENSYLSYAESKIISKTKHIHGKVVNSGNAAILVAMNAIKGPILIPDQGAWHGFKQIAKFLNKEIIIFKTDLGLITIKNLDDVLTQNKHIASNDNDVAIFLTSFAAYSAEQPIAEISNWCRNNGVLLVEDASGAITDPKEKLANGIYSDIIVCSTNSPKVVNVGDGGFITTNRKDIFEDSRLLLNICKSNNITNKGISTELDFSQDNLKKTIEATTYIKNNLDNVIHQNKRGTNILLKSKNPHILAKNLKTRLNVEGKSMITLCPNYNRIKQKAIAIEIKNLATESLIKENLDEIIEIVKRYQSYY
ncbi:MAG: DegT/DnrJ/EryC1/StrS family aminotransferase [Methanobrevibacter sp.]|nr:DegT/DnrJ/EryC1/StrS family aminotransferase [Methanobrevibacter sp.]